MEQKIDYVFPFVDGNEAIWYAAYKKFCESKNLRHLLTQKERFRSWNLLRYYFRCLEKNMPFINNVYMIVSNIEQVPKWLDKTKVKIILHRDIIPEKYLPTFSSPSIEMFIGNIPGLSERFIYGNDDTFVVSPTTPSNFFTVDGKAKINLLEKLCDSTNSSFSISVKNEYELIAKYYNKQNSKIYLCPEHGLMPMLLSSVKHASEIFERDIEKSIKPYRTDNDINQYLYIFDMYFNNKLAKNNTKFKYFGTQKALTCIVNTIKNRSTQCLCINDHSWPDFNYAKAELACAFYEMYPKKSKYEIMECKKPMPIDKNQANKYYLYF